MTDYKYSVKNTTAHQREKIKMSEMAYSMIDSQAPSKETVALVDEYVAGKMEISDVLEKTIGKYRQLGIAK